MKTILVPTDFSNNAYCALYYAAKLFEKEPCRFIILNSFKDQILQITDPFYVYKSEELVSKLCSTSEAKCLAVQHKLISDIEPTKHTFQIIASSFFLIKAIQKVILKENVDFLVMGSKGAAAKENYFIGSNSFEVIESIKEVPLLIIPDQLEYKKPKKLGLASGFKRGYSKKQLAPLKAISKLFNAKTKIIYVFEGEKLNDTQLEHLQNLLKTSKKDGFELQWLPETRSKADTIMEYVYEEQIDILAICYHEHSFLSALFRENLVKEISQTIRTPLLILPSNDL